MNTTTSYRSRTIALLVAGATTVGFGTFLGSTAGSALSPAPQTATNPAIDIEKEVSVDGGTTWHDADTSTGPTVTAGANSVYFRFTVANVGDVSLENIEVADDSIAVDQTGVPATLAAGTSFQLVEGPFSAASGQHTNTATASSTEVGGTLPQLPADDGTDTQFLFVFENGAIASGTSDEHHIDLDDFSSDIDASDLTNHTDIECHDDFGFTDGDAATDGWSDRDDDSPNPDDDPGWRLAGVQIRHGGELCLDAGNIVGAVTDSDSANYLGQDVPAGIDIEKLISVDGGTTWFDADDPTGPQARAGVDTVTFKFVVTNNGGRDLTGVTVSEVSNTDSDYSIDFAAANAAAPDPFAIGDSFEFELGPFTAEAGQHENVVKVDATTSAPPAFDPQAWYDQYGLKYVFRIILSDGTLIDGTSDPNTVIVPSDQADMAATVVPAQTFSEGFHISCSDDWGFTDPDDELPDGWGEKGAPIQGLDNGPIVAYAIYKDGNIVAPACNYGDVTPEPVNVSDTDDAHYLGIIPASIGDQVWEDVDGDGVQDVGEAGIDDVLVELLDDEGNVIDSQTTSDGGYYLFDELWPGTYSLRFTPPAGKALTVDNNGGDAVDSDANQGDGETAQTVLSAGENDLTWDAGVVTPGIALIKCVGDATVTSGTVTAPISGASCSPGFGADADDADGSDVPVFAPGTTATFTYLVENTGTQSFPLAVVTLTDDILGTISGPVAGDDADNVLEPGEVWVYQATSTVLDLGDPANATATVDGCTSNPDSTPQRNAYENVGTVTVPGGSDSDPAHYCNPVPTIDIEKATNGNDADGANDADVPVIAPGGTVTWTYVVTNTGTVSIPLADITVTDDIDGVGPTFDTSSDVGSDSILSPNEKWTYTATGTAGDLATQPTGSTIVDGCTDIPATGDPARDTYENIGTVTIPGDSDSDPSHYCNPAPSIDIEKATNGNDADGANGADVPVIAAGQTVTWTYVVTNTGTVSIPLADITVTDDIDGVDPTFDTSSDVGSDSILSPNEKWTYTATGTAGDLETNPTGMTIVDGCSNVPVDGDPERATYENIGTVTIPGDSDTDPSHYCNPAPTIRIEKATNTFDADGANGGDVPVIAPGDTVTWTYVITNTGTVSIPFADITVTDDIDGVDPVWVPVSDDGDGILDPGEQWTYTATGTAGDLATRPGGMTIVDGCSNVPVDGDPERATYENIGTVTIPGGSDTDPSHYCNPAPSIDIEKLTNGAQADGANDGDVPVVEIGGDVVWTYIVTNTGLVSIPLADVTVTDSVSDVKPQRDPSSDVNFDGILSPGEQWTYTATGLAENLAEAQLGEAIVQGCRSIPVGTDPERNTYENIGRVEIPGDSDEDPSHYCNPLAEVGDLVWNDRDRDGIQDDGEPGLEGVTVKLFNVNPDSPTGALVATLLTDENGNYLFQSLPPGEYYVEFEPFDQWGITTQQDTGGDDTVDSDADPATGRTIVFRLAGGDSDLTRDAGLFTDEPEVDLEIVKTTSASIVGPGNEFFWTLDVKNNGPDTAVNVVVGDIVPSPFIVFDVSSSEFDCGHIGNVVTCTKASMVLDETGAVRIDVRVAEDALGGEVCNVGTVETDTAETDLNNNSDEACVDIPEQNPPTTPPPTVTLPKTGSDGTESFVQFGVLFLLLGAGLMFGVRRRAHPEPSAG